MFFGYLTFGSEPHGRGDKEDHTRSAFFPTPAAGPKRRHIHLCLCGFLRDSEPLFASGHSGHHRIHPDGKCFEFLARTGDHCTDRYRIHRCASNPSIEHSGKNAAAHVHPCLFRVRLPASALQTGDHLEVRCGRADQPLLRYPDRTEITAQGAARLFDECIEHPFRSDPPEHLPPLLYFLRTDHGGHSAHHVLFHRSARAANEHQRIEPEIQIGLLARGDRAFTDHLQDGRTNRFRDEGDRSPLHGLPQRSKGSFQGALVAVHSKCDLQNADHRWAAHPWRTAGDEKRDQHRTVRRRRDHHHHHHQFRREDHLVFTDDLRPAHRIGKARTGDGYRT